jgi:hypothetical protein
VDDGGVRRVVMSRTAILSAGILLLGLPGSVFAGVCTVDMTIEGCRTAVADDLKDLVEVSQPFGQVGDPLLALGVGDRLLRILGEWPPRRHDEERGGSVGAP